MGTAREFDVNQAFAFPNRELSFFRTARGKQFDAIMGNLAMVASKVKSIELPTDFGHAGTCTQLIKRKELLANRHALNLKEIDSKTVASRLVMSLPTVLSPITATAETLDVHRNKQGERYLSLMFSEETGFDLDYERRGIWRVLESIADPNSGGLRWRNYDPDIRLAYINKYVPENVVTNIGRYISKMLPFAVELDPIITTQV